MTERLYYHDSYLRHFAAEIVELLDGGVRAYLDRTAFYPTSGGQPHDVGWLNGVEVLDVVDEGDRIAHILAKPLLAGEVRGQVDWERRYDLMQQHSGQHLLSAIFADRYGWPTASVHVGTETSTLDLEVPALSDTVLADVERQANAVVMEARPIVVSFEEASSAVGLRKSPERSGVIRIVTITGLDRSACGGTHVASTAEIGPIVLGRVERVRRAMRLEFQCGFRALRRVRSGLDDLAAVGRELGCGVGEVARVLRSRLQELRESRAAFRRLRDELAELRARFLYERAVAGATGVRWIVDRARHPEGARALASAVAALPRAAYVGETGDLRGIVIAVSEDSGLHAAELLRTVVGGEGGKGGGSARLAEGMLPQGVSFEEALATIGVGN